MTIYLLCHLKVGAKIHLIFLCNEVNQILKIEIMLILEFRRKISYLRLTTDVINLYKPYQNIRHN